MKRSRPMTANTFYQNGLSLVELANGPCLPYGTVPEWLPSMAPSEMLRMPVPEPDGNTWEDDWVRIGGYLHPQSPFRAFTSSLPHFLTSSLPHQHIPIRKQHQRLPPTTTNYHQLPPAPSIAMLDRHADSRFEVCLQLELASVHIGLPHRAL